MYINHDDLVSLATGPSSQGEQLLKSMDREVVSYKRTVSLFRDNFFMVKGWNSFVTHKLLNSSSLKLFLRSDCTGKAFFAHINVPWNFILLKVTYTLNKAYEDSKNIKII